MLFVALRSSKRLGIDGFISLRTLNVSGSALVQAWENKMIKVLFHN